MNSVRSNNLRLKYQRFTLSGCKDIVLRNFNVAKTQLLNFYLNFFQTKVYKVIVVNLTYN